MVFPILRILQSCRLQRTEEYIISQHSVITSISMHPEM
ncbi:hypothetical protein [Terribacillus sp. AE2B 122]|nr:hypothetical protein [Terribacillus sp. AE2B 122]